MSDYLTDDDQVDRIKQLWKDYGMTVVLALAIGIGGTIGWDFYKSHTETQSQEAADLYNAYIEADSLGEPVGLFVEELAADHSNSAYYVFTLLREAKEAVDDEEYETALGHLTIAMEAAEGSPVSDLVVLRKARLEFQLDQDDVALNTLTHVVSAGFQWQAFVLKGDIHFAAGDLDQARQAYQAATDNLPDGIDSAMVDIRLASVPPAS